MKSDEIGREIILGVLQDIAAQLAVLTTENNYLPPRISTLLFFEEHEAKLATNGYKYLNALDDLDQWACSQVKYNDDLDEKELKLFEQLRAKIREFLDDRGCSLEDSY